jgi:hypothetical protein
MMDELNVFVFNEDDDMWHECGGVQVSSELDDDLASLIGKGLAWERDWIPGSVTLSIRREERQGWREIYKGC